jgi:hypothetical protein
MRHGGETKGRGTRDDSAPQLSAALGRSRPSRVLTRSPSFSMAMFPFSPASARARFISRIASGSDKCLYDWKL